MEILRVSNVVDNTYSNKMKNFADGKIIKLDEFQCIYNTTFNYEYINVTTTVVPDNKKFNINILVTIDDKTINGISVTEYSFKDIYFGVYLFVKVDFNLSILIHTTLTKEINMDYMLDLKKHLKTQTTIKGRRFIIFQVYFKQLMNDIECIELLYLLILNKIRNEVFIHDNYKDLLLGVLSYNGYDEPLIKPKSIKNKEDIFNTLMYILVNTLIGKGRKPLIDEEELDLYYRKYVFYLIDEKIISK